MTDREILESLLQGKKLTSKKLCKNEYIYLNELDNLVDENGKDIRFCFFEPDDYIDTDSLEEYVEYVDFVTAMKHIINGGKAKRKDRSFYISLQNRNEFSLVLYKADILTKDWILL